jgi:multidrug transporter EmrE-like cation transporter
MTSFIAIFFIGTFVSSISQTMLKTAADIEHKNTMAEYLNPKVIFAYLLFLGATICSVYSYKAIPLSWGPILETSGYLFISVLSIFALKEKIGKRKVCGLAIIIVGIVVYAL